jgi:hypothetical protein
MPDGRRRRDDIVQLAHTERVARRIDDRVYGEPEDRNEGLGAE